MTGRLITAELQTLTRERIDAAVTNIDHGHITKFSTVLPERFSVCVCVETEIEFVCRSFMKTVRN